MEYTLKILEEKPDYGLIDLSSEVLGGSDAQSFASIIDNIAQEKVVKNLIVDLSKVELINSSGLGMLVSGVRTLKASKINFILISIPQKVKYLLEITHLDTVFTCYEDLATALKSE